MDSTQASTTSPRKQWKTALDIVTSLGMLAAAATIIVSHFTTRAPGRPAFAIPKSPISIGGADVRGEHSAKIGVLAFMDFECPFCAKFVRDTLPAVDEHLLKTGQIRLAFRHLPLPMHKYAGKAAEAAECAARQGKFWAAHDKLYENVASLALLDLREMAGGLNLDKQKFDTCMKGEATDRVTADAAQAKELGVSSTPLFLVGTFEPDGRLRVRETIRGASSLADFQAVFDRISKATNPSS